jgi:hypothetical protein
MLTIVTLPYGRGSQINDNPNGSRPPSSMGRPTALWIVVRIDDMKGIILAAALMSAISSPALAQTKHVPEETKAKTG